MTDELTATIVRSEDDPPSLIPVLGGYGDAPGWEEYLTTIWNAQYHPHLRAIRRAVEEAGLVGTCADEFCNDHHFLLSDGTAFGFSWRAWGDLMSAIVGRGEGYMAYYMRCLHPEGGDE